MAAIVVSCKPVLKSVFDKRTLHEKYQAKLEKSGLDKLPEGQQWIYESQAVLHDPDTLKLKNSKPVIFDKKKDGAQGLDFYAKQGQRILFDIEKKDTMNFVLYADLFRQENDSSFDRLLSPDTNLTQFSMDIEETGTYLLRLQPELYRDGKYSVSVTVSPSLEFPVAHKKARAGSFWGDPRDGGKRKHEGIDIFAPKRTPVVAVADGHITGVRDGGIGGKSIWMRQEDKNLYHYYAHLDEHLVQEGQKVSVGDTLGLVGNTGNAKNTPPHLHFGIYTRQGPVDPEPFIGRGR